MKYCPKCKSQYSNNTLEFCLEDGSPLLENDPEAETVKNQTEPAYNFIHEIIRLEIGDYFDFTTPHFTVRLTLQGFVEDAPLPKTIFTVDSPLPQLAADLRFDVHGFVYAGEGTKRTSLTDFLIPASATSEQQEFRSVFFFYLIKEKAVIFRVFVKHINIHSRKAELDIAYFRHPRA